MDTLCGQNLGYFSVKHGGPNRNQRSSKDKLSMKLSQQYLKLIFDKSQTGRNSNAVGYSKYH